MTDPKAPRRPPPELPDYGAAGEVPALYFTEKLGERTEPIPFLPQHRENPMKPRHELTAAARNMAAHRARQARAARRRRWLGGTLAAALGFLFASAFLWGITGCALHLPGA